MTFSCHSWRHLFPTAGRQLRLGNETLNDMGHWAPKSGMPQRYDSAVCVSELTGKATVRRAFQDGRPWMRAIAGRFSRLYLLGLAKKSTRQSYKCLGPGCVGLCRVDRLQPCSNMIACLFTLPPAPK